MGLALLALTAGCGIVSIEAGGKSGGSTPASTPSPGATREASEASGPSAPAPVVSEPPPSCPADLTIAAPRTVIIDGRFITGVPEAQYGTFHWGTNHGKVPPSAFFLTHEQAVATVIAAETKHPDIVPAGFRDDLAKAPRDAELRLRMARCEVLQPGVHRRGAHDAAMAFLLGASPVAAGRTIVADWEFKLPHHQSCSTSADCGPKVSCMASEKRCLDPHLKAEIMASEAEIVVEDTLSRALMKDFYAHGAEWPAGYSLRDPMTDALLTPESRQELSRVALVIWGRQHIHKWVVLVFVCERGRAELATLGQRAGFRNPRRKMCSLPSWKG